MIDTNENLLGAASDVSEYIKWDEHIRTIELFRLLLQQQLNAENTNEEGADYTVESSYMFSVLLQFAVSHGYEEEEFVSRMLSFYQSGYVTLSTIEDGDVEPKELIQKQDYKNIQVYLNKEKILQVLLDESISINRIMQNLMSQLQKQESVLARYDSGRQEMTRQHQEMGKWHEESNAIRTEWEEAVKADLEKRERLTAELNAEVEKITKEKVDSQLEDELRLSGKIGNAMQEMQKDIIQFMGIFIAIFALLGLNIGNAGKWSTVDFFHINLVLTASMATLLFLISIIMNGKKDSRTSCMGILTAALWILAAFVFFVFPYLKDEVISFWATYYR